MQLMVVEGGASNAVGRWVELKRRVALRMKGY